ncbi:carbohydrate-binding protein [Streptomyces cahuitamycinicus]|nr:carbohydrate-binding protein [Streptomyces cahuitamycinicus]
MTGPRPEERISRGVSHWEVPKSRNLARAGGHHSVVSRRSGDHIGFRKVDMNGVHEVALRTAAAELDYPDGGEPLIEVRVDAPDGPLLGTVPVSATGDIQEYRTVRGRLRPMPGLHDLFLVFLGGGLYLDSIQLLASV